MNIPTVRGPLKTDTIPRMFRRAAETYPEHAALLIERDNLRQEFTYRELRERVEYLARSLRKMGFKHGDKIGLIGENCPDWEASYPESSGRAAWWFPSTECLRLQKYVTSCETQNQSVSSAPIHPLKWSTKQSPRLTVNSRK